jgi:tetratricopeptide (TPR) repeat protein
MNLLAKMHDLKVAGRTSSFAFKGRNEDLREIGEALGVNHIVEGSVRRSGDRLRITAQLVKVEDGFHIWSETYDRQMADIFDIQDDVASSITEELKLHLAPPSDRATNNTEAYALYLQALAMSDFPDGDIGEAISLFDRALEMDPDFAKAYELKAMAYWAAAGWTIDIGLGQRLVYDAAVNALSLDPNLVVSRAFSIAANPVEFSWVDYIDAFERAVNVERDNVRVLDTIVMHSCKPAILKNH